MVRKHSQRELHSVSDRQVTRHEDEGRHIASHTATSLVAVQSHLHCHELKHIPDGRGSGVLCIELIMGTHVVPSASSKYL